MLAMWVSALLEDAGRVWHHVTLEGTCKPAWACGFVPMRFAHRPGRNPKPPQAGPGSPNRARLILLREKKNSSQKASPGRVSKTNPEPWLTAQKRESSQRFSFSLSGGGSPAALQPGRETRKPRCHQCRSLTPRPWQEEQTQLGTSGCGGGGAGRRDAREAGTGLCAGSGVGAGCGILREVPGQQEKSRSQAPRDRLWSRGPG